MEFTNSINLIGNAIERFGIIILLSYGMGFFHIVVLKVTLKIIEVLSEALICGKLINFRMLLPVFHIDVIKKNLRFGLNMSLVSIFSIIQKQIDKLVLSKLFTLKYTGFYSYAFSNLSKGLVISQAISNAVFPDLCEKQSNRKLLFHQYIKLQDLVCLINVPVFSLMPFIAIPLYSYIFDSETANLLFLPIIVLSIGFFMNGTVMIPYRIILASGKSSIASKSAFYSMIIGVPVTIILVNIFGLTGAGFGWITYFAVNYVYSIPKVFRDCLYKPTHLFFFHLAKIVLLFVLSYGIALYCIHQFIKFEVITIAIFYLTASIIYVAGFYLIASVEFKQSAKQNLVSFQQMVRKIYVKIE